MRRVAVASCGPELFVTGGHVVFAEVRKQKTIVFSVPITLDQPPRRLGSAHAFFPSATDGRVWLAGVDCNKRKMVGVKEVTVEGKVTLQSHRRVPGSWLSGAVERGLVLQRAHSLSVWDPSTGRTRGRPNLEAVIALQRNRMFGVGGRVAGRSLQAGPHGRVLARRLAAGDTRPREPPLGRRVGEHT